MNEQDRPRAFVPKEALKFIKIPETDSQLQISIPVAVIRDMRAKGVQYVQMFRTLSEDRATEIITLEPMTPSRWNPLLR